LHFTVNLRRAGGTTFPAEIDTTPLVSPAGRYEGSVSVVTDITDRQEAETDARFRSILLDSIGDAVAATKADGTIVYVNQAAERLMGWRAADVLGRNACDVFETPLEVRHRAQTSLVHQGSRHRRRVTMSRRTGDEFAAHLTTTPAIDDHGAIVGFVVVIDEQTERDQLARDAHARAVHAETIALLGARALRSAHEVQAGVTAIVTEVVEATRRVLRADRAMVLQLCDERDLLEVLVASPANAQHTTVPIDRRSFPGSVALAANVVVVDDTSVDRRFDFSPEGATASAIGAPIFSPRGILGVLIVESSIPMRFDHGADHFIQGMANVVGAALRK
jgi:PAS domain S-box-containing protein